MWARMATGAAALGAYGWQVHDPVGSYESFFNISNWLTSHVISGEGAWAWGRNMVNLILIDQAKGFFLGMAVMALISVIFWPFRAAGRWTWGKIAGRRGDDLDHEDEHWDGDEDDFEDTQTRRIRRRIESI